MKKTIICAEAGNSHEGKMRNAFNLIFQAKLCGCDAVKFQAGTAKGFARNTNQIKFYKKYELGYENYLKLIDYGNSINIPVFFSIWNKEFEGLRSKERYHKIPVRQSHNTDLIKRLDLSNTFISISSNIYYKFPEIKNAVVLYCVDEYPAKNISWDQYTLFKNKYKRVGFSDHFEGIEKSKIAITFGAVAIEKHFTLNKNTKGLRDHKLSADPKDMKKLIEFNHKYNIIITKRGEL